MHQKVLSDVPSIQPHFCQGGSMITIIPGCSLNTHPYQASHPQVTPRHLCIHTTQHHNFGQASWSLEKCTLGAYPAMGPTTSVINKAYRIEEKKNVH